jgi:hypothetical protein
MSWVISDMNGELYPAHELGNALLRVRQNVPSIGSLLISFPAICFGDTGATSGALALLVGISSFQRGRVPADDALILSSGLGGQRAAALLTRPDARP